MKINQKTREITAKQSALYTAKDILKKEFVGIDEIIDKVIDLVSSWYLFSVLQYKPMVINLRGLTGTGMSSLVKRLSELLSCEESVFRFDLGNKNNRFSFHDSIEELCFNADEHPPITGTYKLLSPFWFLPFHIVFKLS